MSERGVAQFIAVVGLHFPRPKFNDDEALEAAWVASMTRTLSGFSDDVLARAAQRILERRHPKRDGAYFPKPAECSDICLDVQKLHKLSEVPLLARPKGDDWSDDRLALAFDLVNGEMGRRAAREGWVDGLYHFARKNMRLPQPAEIGTLIAGVRETERIIAELDAGPASMLTTAIIRFGKSVLARRSELKDAVLDGVVTDAPWFRKG